MPWEVFGLESTEPRFKEQVKINLDKAKGYLDQVNFMIDNMEKPEMKEYLATTDQETIDEYNRLYAENLDLQKSHQRFNDFLQYHGTAEFVVETERNLNAVWEHLPKVYDASDDTQMRYVRAKRQLEKAKEDCHIQ